MKSDGSFLLLLVVFVSIVSGNNNNNFQRECKQNDSDGQTTFLVKIGGSCITNKGKKETLDLEMLEWFSTTMAQILLTNNNTTTAVVDGDNEDSSCRTKKQAVNYILVHGAGSFGHFFAKEYGIRSQMASPPPIVKNQTYLMEGVAKTRLSVQALNRHVLSSLIDHGIPAVGISPPFGLPCPATSNDEFFEESLGRAVVSALEAGLVPVLHGDACLYSKGGAGIVGGDVLLEVLSQVLTTTTKLRTVFVTDVPGIFTSNPKEDPNATLVSAIRIDPNNGVLLEVEVNASASSHEHDVTGGIAGKLGSAISIVRQTAAEVIIVQCGTSDAHRALRGQNFTTGTRVLLA